MPQRHLQKVQGPDKLESRLPACMDTALRYTPLTGCQMADVSSLPPRMGPCESGALSCVKILQSTGAASNTCHRACQNLHQCQGLPESSSGLLHAQGLALALVPWVAPCRKLCYFSAVLLHCDAHCLWASSLCPREHRCCCGCKSAV